MKLLVAEDSLSMRKVVVRMLHAMGYDEVLESPNGADAWEKIQHNDIDLLLTDYNMPLLSGLELTQRVRGQYTASQLPILMFTVRNQRNDIVAAVKAGVNGYIAKPFTAAQLRKHLGNIIEKHATSGLRNQAQSIIRDNRPPSQQDDSPFVIIAEKIADGKALSQLGNRDYTDLIYRFTTRISQLGESEDAHDLSYYIDDKSQQIVRSIRAHRDRLKMIIISNEISGGGLTLARLARVNQSHEFVVALLVHVSTELPIQARASLEKLGVLLLERHRLDDAFLDKFFRDELQSRIHIVPHKNLSPEQIIERIETDISLMTSLPVLPGVYQRIMSLSRYRNSDIKDWIEAVKTDPLSSAMLIRRANSPIYGLHTKVEDVAKAVILLGKSTVRELIVADSLRRTFHPVKEADFSVEEYWAHSFATAMFARILSFSLDREQWTDEQKKEFDQLYLSDRSVEYLKALRLYSTFELGEDEDPFVSGMMHDIGKVALVHCYPGLYNTFVRTLEQSNWTLTMKESEEQTSGVDHVQVGGILARNWQLAQYLQNVIHEHHPPDKGDSLARLICLSSFMASAFYSYPAKAKTPLKQAVEPMVDNLDDRQIGFDPNDLNATEHIEAMLPKGFLRSIGVSLDQILQLSSVLGADVRKQLESIRGSMKD